MAPRKKHTLLTETAKRLYESKKEDLVRKILKECELVYSSFIPSNVLIVHKVNSKNRKHLVVRATNAEMLDHIKRKYPIAEWSTVKTVSKSDLGSKTTQEQCLKIWI